MLDVVTAHTQQKSNDGLDAQKSQQLKRKTMDKIAEKALNALQNEDPNQTRQQIKN